MSPETSTSSPEDVTEIKNEPAPKKTQDKKVEEPVAEEKKTSASIHDFLLVGIDDED
jgi:hypothetical protein